MQGLDDKEKNIPAANNTHQGKFTSIGITPSKTHRNG